MYLDFYNLHLKPFQISTDPKFLWLGEKHKEALAVLKYGILDNKGFLLLTGDVGTGKTTLLNALIDSLGDNVLVALVTDPGLGKMDFFNFVANSFEMNKSFKSKGEFLIYLKNYLLEINRQNKQTLLIIDECQHLNQKLLEEVRLLSNIEKFNSKLINIFFVGQSEFNDIILRPRNRAIRQRITINYNISALSQSETDKYIQFRLHVAGSKETIFTAKAIKEVYKFSNGYPRLINIICDQALLTGYVKEKRKIDEKIVAECAGELKIPYGKSIKKSLATPEAADESSVEPPLADISPGAAVRKNTRHLNRPLVIAFIVVMLIWLGLVAIFFLNQQRPETFDLMSLAQSGPDVTARQIDPETTQSGTDGTVGENQIAAVTPKPAAVDGPPVSQPSGEQNVIPVKSYPSSISADEQKTKSRISLQEIKEKFGAYPEVQFGFNSNNLDSESYDILGLIARYCLENPGAAIVLRGYTDSSGVRAYNLKLSEFRADMVKTFLVGRGVKASNINAIAMGPGAPGPEGASTSKDESQRKVVIEIIPPPGS
jgi:general secretion pathway protein A